MAWAGEALGGTVVATRQLRGGTTSAVHRLTVRHPGGTTRQVVLRRYVRPEVLAQEPDFVEREARTLRLVESLDVPTP